MKKIAKDIQGEIISVVKEKFNNNGFLCNKQRFFERRCEGGNINVYEILLSKKKDFYSLHLRLSLKNFILMKGVNEILRKVLNDPEYIYPGSWDESEIKKSNELMLSNDTISMVTDWRIFKGDKSLDEFNNVFSIWMCAFKCLSEIKDLHAQLLKSVDYALDWFALVGSDEWIINNSLYPSLYLLNMMGDKDKLNEKYNYVLSVSRNKKEVELYFKYLTL
ncbi:hypothetical protein VP018_001792 [Morganella morganii]|nr:hypothetical protein [Morganella morganii]